MSPMALPCFANDISTEGRRAPKAPEHPGIRSPLNKLTVYKCQRAERRCAMGRSAARHPTQQHGGRHGGVVGGESEESTGLANHLSQVRYKSHCFYVYAMHPPIFLSNVWAGGKGGNPH